ncbi:MAG: type I-E CRISPR-associated protein Cse1/CasA [Advenella sp.]|nr:type I-E CRISPR-associated protein Cse1/CasA [Advenella sp.]
MENQFNLIDEPWIPVADRGRVSLRDIFICTDYQSLGGTPVQKIAVFKLLLAIAQAATTPEDEAEWQALGIKGLAHKCLAYLEKWHDHFYLYGENPFLQMPAIKSARALSFGAFLPEISTGNTTVLTESQVERQLSSADQALLLLLQMGFALSGKKTDNRVVLSKGYQGKSNAKGKPSTGKTGPSVAHMGLLHNFVMARTLLDSLWINLFTSKAIRNAGIFPEGIGTAPWENMPEGEACPVALALKNSYMGRLMPVCRFCLLAENAMHYSEGIDHAGYKEGVQDPSVAVNHSGKEPKALWTDPEKRPWRELTSLLGFFEQTGSQGFLSLQITYGLEQAINTQEEFSIWSGGLRVRSNAGEQYVSGTDDIVESQIWLHRDILGESWFVQLKSEMAVLDGLAKTLYGRILGYFKDLTADGTKIAAQATHMFWTLCERDFQLLVDNCEYSEAANKNRDQLQKKFVAYQHYVYDFFCPNETARQIDAWAKNRPVYKFITSEA